MLWKSRVTPQRGWGELLLGPVDEAYRFPVAVADCDGDGTPDVVIQARSADAPKTSPRFPSLAIELFSGRTGRRLWSAGPFAQEPGAHAGLVIDRIESTTVEAGGSPDILVRHSDDFNTGGPAPVAPRQNRLARVSGRDGHVIWDAHLADGDLSVLTRQSRHFADFNGDGSLDMVVVLMQLHQKNEGGYELKAFSLRDGALLWSHFVDYSVSVSSVKYPEFVAVDLDGDGLSEVVLIEEQQAAGGVDLVVKALDGRDGSVRWTRPARTRPNSGEALHGFLAAGNFDGHGRHGVCVGWQNTDGSGRLAVLDAGGREPRAASFLSAMSNR